MNTHALVKLKSYWDTLRDGRIAPYRAELDPRRFDDVLAHMFILEQLSPNQVRVRLGGQDLCEMMGMEVRGMPPEAFVDAPHRADFQRHLTTVLAGPAVCELDLGAVDARGRPMEARMLLLPLRSDFGEVSRILGCVVTDRKPVRAPVNFTIREHRIEIVRPNRSEAEEHGTLPGFAAPAAAFNGPAVRKVLDNPAPHVSRPRRGHLRLVSGN